MPKEQDLTGRRSGRLVAVRRNGHVVYGGQRKLLWLCRCDCGGETTIPAGAVTQMTTRSCGCRAGKRTHGQANTPVYRVWHSMLQRCNHPNDQNFPDYGGRGIRVCAEWADFERFAADMGPRPLHGMLERADVDGPYSPSNCRWASPLEQANNRRNNRRITFNGVTHTLAEWARLKGLTKGCLRNRLTQGWSLADALERKADGSRRRLLQVK